MVEGSVKKISFPKYRLAQKKRKVLLRFVPGISEKEIDWVKFPTLFFVLLDFAYLQKDEIVALFSSN